MDIKEFVKTTLSQLCEAIDESSEALHKNITLSHPSDYNKPHTIEFDLAVEATDTSSSGGKGGLKIHVVEAGIDRATATSSTTISRIKFAIRAGFSAEDYGD